ncbi:GNAT family N-acetyltransferase [Hymenobacter norwichensis]|uniref:GNAT family N-acetyltransferase n=1 Tax=Hymenobacter norwichensis TaxID=223903 RepID=UPI0003B443D5|nr:GNAT family N-acetyltransferase [Hymenobacter norwichensis]
MPTELSSKHATADDIPVLVALVNSAYRGEASTQGWTTEAHLLDGQRTDAAALLDLLAAPKATILQCAAPTGQLLGSVYLHPEPDGVLYMGMLSVAPKQQGQGIGKYLLEAAEAYAHQNACSRIRITVISVRTELLAWYERHGYRRTGATEAFPTDTRFGIPRQPLELLVLEKQLAR